MVINNRAQRGERNRCASTQNLKQRIFRHLTVRRGGKGGHLKGNGKGKN
jgi:hypothetical protein